jgi:hypothetical protein
MVGLGWSDRSTPGSAVPKRPRAEAQSPDVVSEPCKWKLRCSDVVAGGLQPLDDCALPAKRNEDEPVEEPEPLKGQGDPLTD